MTPDHLRLCLQALHWTQRSLALVLGVSDRQVRRWSSGECPAPEDVAEWLQRLATVHARNPPPTRRKRISP